MRRLRRGVAAKGGRLLRILLLRFRALSADPGGARWRERCRFVLSGELVAVTERGPKYLKRALEETGGDVCLAANKYFAGMNTGLIASGREYCSEVLDKMRHYGASASAAGHIR
jgi:hypothetical protein